MTILDSLLLGVLQGITEFLPISSSGHLIIAESWLHLPVHDLQSFDVAVHFGTLLAIFVYFRKDFIALIKTLMEMLSKMTIKKTRLSDKSQKNHTLLGYLIVATIPTIIVGLFFNDLLKENFRNPTSVAVMLIVIALYFVFAEWMKKKRPSTKIGLIQATFIGIAQSFALIPGVSRSGITISTGLVQGVNREDAARFSFLIGSIAISAATVLSVYKVAKGDFFLPEFSVLATGIASSFFAGYISVYLLMKFLKSHSLHVFAVYRILLAVGILFLF